jgi:hypothetical protein
MDIAKCHDVHKMWTLLTLPKKRAEDCSRQCGSCKPRGEPLYDTYLQKNWVCFAISADQFWTLCSFVMGRVWASDLGRGQAWNQR